MKAPAVKKVKFEGGSSGGGFLARDNTLSISGTSKARLKITIFDDGVKIGSVKANKKCARSFDRTARRAGSRRRRRDRVRGGFEGAIDTSPSAEQWRASREPFKAHPFDCHPAGV